MPKKLKNYYTLEEAAKSLGIDTDSLVDALKDGELIPSASLGPMRGAYWEGPYEPYIYRAGYGWDWEGQRVETGEDTINSNVWHIPTFASQNIHYEKNNRAFIRITECFLSLRIPEDNKWFGPEELLGRENDKVYLSDLVISSEQLAICKDNIKITGKKLLPYERDNLLRTIGLLARACVRHQPASSLGSLDNPNYSQLTELVLTLIEQNDIKKSGLGPTILRDRITKGLSLIKLK